MFIQSRVQKAKHAFTYSDLPVTCHPAVHQYSLHAHS